MAIVNGTPVNFSFQSASGITIPGKGGILLQTASYSKPTKRTLVMDGNGNRTTSIHSDPITKATIKWKISGSTLADALTNTALDAPGTFVQITACPSLPELVSALNYEVVGGELPHSNEDVAEVSLEIELAANIQSVAS